MSEAATSPDLLQSSTTVTGCRCETPLLPPPVVAKMDTLRKHVRALERAFEIATRRIVIVSPFISSAAIGADRLAEKVATALRNDVEVKIYTDSRLDMRNGKLKDSAKEGRQLLERQGAELKVKQGIHNKALAVDDSLLIEGSFNWLSAQRDESGPYHRHEVSVVVKTADTPRFVERLLSVLDAMPEEKT
jgi:phosphatidylserine/phosphatidylglycerophosphate/cardiolipin synthase-like enzyme